MSISLDGSAFDSSQFVELMRCVDDKFFLTFKPEIRRILEYNFDKVGRNSSKTVEQALEDVMNCVTQGQNDVFVYLP